MQVVPLVLSTLAQPIASAIVLHDDTEVAVIERMMSTIDFAASAAVIDFHDTRALLSSRLNPTSFKFHELLVRSGVSDRVADMFRNFFRDPDMRPADLVMRPHRWVPIFKCICCHPAHDVIAAE